MTVARRKAPDTFLLLSLGGLIIAGLIAFSSAALGLLAREGEPVGSIVANHFLLGFGLGALAFFAGLSVPYTFWRRSAPYLYALALIVTALVLVPGLGLEHGGSRRWLLLGPFSLQPAEPLKIGLIFVLALYFAHIRERIADWRYGLGGFALLCAGPTLLLLLQPDHGTLGVMLFTAGAMYIAAGGPLRHVAAVGAIGIIMLGGAFFSHGYVRDRIDTFLNPANDPGGSSYQIKQSLLAIGSGEISGRGYGRGLQKFQYLPEPVGDSIFAVIGEEFGFIGAVLLVALFALFFLRGYAAAAHSPDFFGGLLAVGITTYIAAHFFLNVGSMVGLVPLTGVPLTFISQGGTALFVALGSVGILANISRAGRSHVLH